MENNELVGEHENWAAQCKRPDLKLVFYAICGTENAKLE
jgi:hypothetical protein